MFVSVPLSFSTGRLERVCASSRMPGYYVHSNGLPATFVLGRRNVCEGYWAANESWKKSHASLFHCIPLLLKRKKYFTNPSCLPHCERKASPRSIALVNRISLEPFPLHTLVSCTSPVLRHRCRVLSAAAFTSAGRWDRGQLAAYVMWPHDHAICARPSCCCF